MTRIQNLEFKVKNILLSPGHHGFTIIELLVVLAIIAVLSSIGIASFVGYNRTQQFANSVEVLRTTLFTARSRALSQVKQGTTCGSNTNLTLQGYQVLLCCSGVKCPVCHTSNVDYELDIVCEDTQSNTQYIQAVSTGKFPKTSISADAVTIDPVNTTSTSFFFTAVNGAVATAVNQPNFSGAGKMVLKGFGQSKSIIVTQTGVIE